MSNKNQNSKKSDSACLPYLFSSLLETDQLHHKCNTSARILQAAGFVLTHMILTWCARPRIPPKQHLQKKTFAVKHF